MSASTSLSEVVKILDECAPGYTIRLANHSRVIHFNGMLYRTFPKHDPVENGHVRKLVRFFGISACASKHLPGVIKDEQTIGAPDEPTKPKAKPTTQTKAIKKR
jgi:hypothetical protein